MNSAQFAHFDKYILWSSWSLSCKMGVALIFVFEALTSRVYALAYRNISSKLVLQKIQVAAIVFRRHDICQNFYNAGFSLML